MSPAASGRGSEPRSPAALQHLSSRKAFRVTGGAAKPLPTTGFLASRGIPSSAADGTPEQAFKSPRSSASRAAAASTSYPTSSSPTSSFASTAASAAPTTSYCLRAYDPLAAPTTTTTTTTTTRCRGRCIGLPGSLGFVHDRDDKREYELMLSLLLLKRSAIVRPSARLPAYNPLAAAAAAPAPASAASAAPFRVTGSLGFVLDLADMCDYKHMLSLLLEESSAVRSTSARPPAYDPLAAAATAATATAAATPFRLTGSLGFVLDLADTLEYKWMLSVLTKTDDAKDDSGAAPSSAPSSPAAASAASPNSTFSESSTSSPACPSSPTTTASSPFASTTTTTTTTLGPLFPIKPTCHVPPAPYMPLACRLLAAASKGASPTSMPCVGGAVRA